MKRPEAILFDWDNTLVDSWPTIHYAFNRMLTAMERPAWTMAEVRDRVRLSLRDTFPVMFGDRWREAQKLYLDAFRAIHLQTLTPLPGREALLRDLVADGYFVAIVSNKTGPLLRLEAQALGWDRHLARLVGAADAEADKPHRAPVDMALAGTGIAPGESVWFVGDTAVDMECARNADCVPVLLGDCDPADAEFASCKPLLAFRDCTSLFSHLRAL